MLAVVLAVIAFGAVVEPCWSPRGAAAYDLRAGYHSLYGHRHRVRFGMRNFRACLAAWSFLMATAHGAGLMLLPLLGPLGLTPGTHHGHSHADMAGSVAQALAAVGVHTGAMLVTIAAIALLVHGWLGIAFLRRGWINLDLVWTAALVATGLLLLL